MDANDLVNLVLAAAWALAALVCWFQPQLDARRVASGRPSRGVVGPRLRVVSTATCTVLALSSLLALPQRAGVLPPSIGLGLAILGFAGLTVTLVLLFQEKRARKS